MHGSTCTDRRPAPRLRALVVGVAAAGALAGCTIPTDTDPGETPAAQTPAVETTADEVGPAPGETEDAALAAQSQRFSEEFDAFAAGLPGRAAIAVVVPGPGGEQEVFAAGEPAAPVAWSTIKVPLARAALAVDPGADADARAAITVSDNPAAEALWARFAGPEAAAEAVEQQIGAAGAPVPAVPTVRLRDGFSIFGQTVWPLADQARYAAATVCTAPHDPVAQMMGEVSAGQSWGLGAVPGARFKGGWGPEPDGRYLARQFGVVDTEIGPVAVALAASGDGGDFDTATAMTGQVTDWLTAHPALLPGPSC